MKSRLPVPGGERPDFLRAAGGRRCPRPDVNEPAGVPRVATPPECCEGDVAVRRRSRCRRRRARAAPSPEPVSVAASSRGVPFVWVAAPPGHDVVDAGRVGSAAARSRACRRRGPRGRPPETDPMSPSKMAVRWRSARGACIWRSRLQPAVAERDAVRLRVWAWRCDLALGGRSACPAAVACGGSDPQRRWSCAGRPRPRA